MAHDDSHTSSRPPTSFETPPRPSTPSLPLTFVHSSHAARLHSHLTRPTFSRALTSPVPSFAPSRSSPRQYSRRSHSPSLTMTPYIISTPRRGSASSFTEIAQALATVPPPSPSPRRGRAAVPVLQLRTAASVGSQGLSLPSHHHPRSKLALNHPTALSPIGAGAENNFPAWMPSSLPPRRSARVESVPIAGILKRKESQKGARKIPSSVVDASRRDRLANGDRPTRDCRDGALSDGSFSSLCSLRSSAPVPLFSTDTICPFRLGGSVIRPPRTAVTLSTMTTGRQRQILRELTNHAGLG